jgi:hypothetical protein
MVTREILLARKRDEYQRHKARYLARQRRWQRENKEEYHAMHKKWRDRHPEKLLAWVHKYLEKLPTLTARARYKRWEDSEDVQALRTDITELQIAKKLHRSIAAVRRRRYDLRHKGA